jgi:hypothetical protein
MYISVARRDQIPVLPSCKSTATLNQENTAMTYRSPSSTIADPDFPPSQGAFPVWSKVFTQPKEQTFREITEHPEAKAKAAYIWVFIVGTLSALISSLAQFVITLAGIQQVAPEFGEIPGAAGVLGTAGLLGAVCGAPVAGLFSVIGFAFGAAIVHATARFFGGQGSFDRLAYALGAITVPFSLLSGLLTPLNMIPYAGFCTLPVILALFVYVLFLQVTAIKAVHDFSWGEAAAALFLPGILGLMLCGLSFLLFMRMAGPSINEIFQQLQQIQ